MPGRMPRVDVLLVSLGGTAGLREADLELAGSLRRAGASVAVARTGRARELRTFAAIEFNWAVNARRATTRALRDVSVMPDDGSAAKLLGLNETLPDDGEDDLIKAIGGAARDAVLEEDAPSPD